MSTYLVTLVVGDFKCLETSSGGTPIRVCTIPGKKHLAEIALESSQEILKYFNSYYTITDMDGESIEEWIMNLLATKLKMISEVVEGAADEREEQSSIMMALIEKLRANMWKKG